MTTLRKLAGCVRYTPLHPQWLLGRRKPPAGMAGCSGLVLDIGAADQWASRFIAEDATYIALDYPDTTDKFYNTRPNIFTDACRLPLRDDCADCVVCLEVLEHVPDPADAMKEIARVLKPGGQAWISMPFMYPLHNEPFDFQRYTEFGLRRDIARANLELDELTPAPHSIKTAGLLMNLALAGGIYKQRTFKKILLLPFGLAAIFIVNISSWISAGIWPNWPSLAVHHELRLHKPPNQ